MPLNKYISEFALNMQAEKQAICRLHELDYLASTNYFDDKSPCHIYMIARRPRLSIDKSSLKYDASKIHFNFRAQIEDSFEEVTSELVNDTRSLDLKIESDFPFSAFKIFDHGKEVVNSNATIYLMKMMKVGYNFGEFERHLDLEILYVGQAYGKAGSRKAHDRLKSHSTMQAIYAEANKNNPDKEILLCLFTFKEWLLTSFDGTKKLDLEEKKLDDSHMENVMNKIVFGDGITEQQVINFTEAALIKYFQPRYNIEYKSTFPNPAHSSYSECYDIDINSICLEIDTEPLFCQIYSAHAPRRWAHYASFSLHTRQDRMTIFNMIY